MAARPTGVTILAVLEIIGGILSLLGGVGLMVLAGFAATVPVVGIFAGVLVALGAALTLLGILSFIVAYGLLKGMGWAWMLALILSIIGVIIGVVSLVQGGVSAVVGIIINVIIIYYLTRPHVKQYFGRL
ncbi:MAG TPA: hypothetical protein EYH45_03790 [Candidatus Caldiarchaeum subterraneum]|uniref:DUF2127 domain-containing protein n=1 Tax=Caldiarchaeum subterraneum TaxID=311458 RepID=A0A832ZVX1_CALS0|nr:hypothetical protein [Aigarchaeota archaeon]HIQ29668.1 hypothetical protein [Candidatus Caldarchaeum subterraneum]